MGTWLQVRTVEGSWKDCVVKIPFNVTFDYGEPEVASFQAWFGEYKQYYMSPLRSLPKVTTFGRVDFYDKEGEHLDQGANTGFVVYGRLIGWRGDPQSVVIVGTVPGIPMFCFSGSGRLRLLMRGEPLLKQFYMDTKFKTVKSNFGE